MKLRKEVIDYIANRIVVQLEEKELIDVEGDHETLIVAVANLIADDLSIEDVLNNEVKELLEKMGKDMDGLDYRKMFQMVKFKIARERGLIL